MNAKTLFLFISLIIFWSCQNDTAKETNDNSISELNIRLEKEPGLIHPIFATSTIGRTVYQYTFLPLADFHPETLELSPILIKDIPVAYEHTLEDSRVTVAYDIEFREDAQWSDGRPVTAEDYLFTINMIKHPLSKATRWKPYIANIYDIKISDTNNRKMTVYCNPDYMLSLEICVTSYILPKHILDPESLLDNTNIDTDDTVQVDLMEKISNTMNQRLDVVQVGPYMITDEATDEYIILTKISDHWGAEDIDNPFLQAYSDKIIMKVVPDEITAITMAKEGLLDIVSLKSSSTFLELRDSDADKFSFHTPQLMFFYYIAMNNTAPFLQEKTMRRAIAHLIDINDVILTLDKGLGVRTTGPFHPTKPYYNKSLDEIKYDIKKAGELLDSNGWEDTDGDGIRDKIIKGIKTPLKLDFYITGSSLSKNIALLFQESAAKGGVQLNIVSKANSLMQKENINVKKYDMAALAQGFDASSDDPYSNWHSDNAGIGGTNKTGYSKPKSDALIEKIRTTRDIEHREELYMELQQIMYEDQPMIFMYSPLMKFIISNDIVATTTSKRPGYLANTFKKRKI